MSLVRVRARRLAGDEDYVPLVEAVQREGLLVYVWFVPDGLSPKLGHEQQVHVGGGPTMPTLSSR